MIARKIVYRGNFTEEALAQIFDITRKNEITGQVKATSAEEVELSLEGDPAVIKLIQHQIDRKVKDHITERTVTPMSFQYYRGVVFLR